MSKGKTTKPDSMSASDLAPFVAAVIEDGIIAEMQRKNKEQKRKIDALESTIQKHESERLLVQVTGQHGRPMYGEKSLKEGRSCINYDGNDSLWSLNFDNNDDECICPFDEEPTIQLEIRIGGILFMPRVLEKLRPIAFDDGEHEDEDDLDKLVYLNRVDFLLDADFNDNDLNDDARPFNRILGRVGPITVRHYKALCTLYDSGIEMTRSDLFEHSMLPATAAVGAQPTRKITLTVKDIAFHKKNISGCISLMKQLGIRTRAPRRETLVEARSDSDVQIDRQIWV